MPVRLEEQRLLVKVAHLYYERGQTQASISRGLSVSQASVSRLLKRAREQGIVSITVASLPGAYPEVETLIREKFGLLDVIVVDSVQGAQLSDALGRATAYYVETTLQDGDIVGLSSWSTSLLSMVKAMHPVRDRKNIEVVQILGGLGNPAAEVHASHMTSRFSSLVNAQAHFLPAPGIASSRQLHAAYLKDPFTQRTLAMFDKVTMALVGIGSVQPSKLIAESGNVFSEAELRLLKEQGAVGDICMRFFDHQGIPVKTELNKRVIAIPFANLKQIPRVVGVAGSEEKLAAIRGALKARLINVLITDHRVALKLAG